MQQYILTARILRLTLKRVVHAAQSTRLIQYPVLNSVLFEFNHPDYVGLLRVAATDSYRLATATTSITGAENTRFALPLKDVKQLFKTLNCKGYAAISIAEKAVTIGTETDTVHIAKTTERQVYPDCHRLFTQTDNPIRFWVSTPEFRALLKPAQARHITCTFEGGFMTLDAGGTGAINDPVCLGKIRIQNTNHTDRYQIRFAHPFLREMVNAHPESLMELQLGADSPQTPYSEDNYYATGAHKSIRVSCAGFDYLLHPMQIV